MAAVKIRIKVNQIELDYEGDEKFLEQDLLKLLTSMGKLPQAPATEVKLPVAEVSLPAAGNGHHGNNGKVVGTTATIAAKLQCKTASDLIIAAAAQFTLVQNKPEFSRKELLEEMRSASGYYKESYNNNYTNYLNRRVRAGDLCEQRKGYFALSADKKAELGKTLAK